MTRSKSMLVIAVLALAGCAGHRGKPTPAATREPLPAASSAPAPEPPPSPVATAPATTASGAGTMPAAATPTSPPPARAEPVASARVTKPTPPSHARPHHKPHRPAEHVARHMARQDRPAGHEMRKKTSAATLALRGNVYLVGAGGQSASSADYRHTLVYFVPSRGDYRPQPGSYHIYTHHRDFDPDWLAVPQGSSVTFTNLDQVKHNVFSVTPGSSFDLGYQSAQQSVTHRFDHPGMVLISCHVHRYMRGNILVVPSRYATTVANDGQFRLTGIPDVPGTLYFWNPRSHAVIRSVAPPFATVTQRLVIDQPAVKTEINLGGGS